MKKLRRFFALLLVVLLALSLLPVSALADSVPDAPLPDSSESSVAIDTGVSYNNGTATVTGTAPAATGTKIYVAGYDANGRMLDAATATVNTGKWSAELKVSNEKLARVKAFQLGGDYAPTAENGNGTMKIVAEAGTVDPGAYDTVLIAESVGNGTVTLDGVTAKNLIVRGGGSNSVELTNGSQIASASVEKAKADGQAPRLAVDSSSGVSAVTVSGTAGAIIEGTGATPGYVGTVTTESAAPDTTISNTNVGKVSAASDLTLKDASVGTVATSGNGVIVSMQDASVSAVTAYAPTVVTGSGTVDKVDASKSVITDAGTSVGTITAKDSTANVTANGTVGTIAASGGTVNVGGASAPVVTGSASAVTVSGSASPVVQATTETITVNASENGGAGVTVANTTGDNTKINVTGTGTAGTVNVENSSATVNVDSGATVAGVATNNTSNNAVIGTTKVADTTKAMTLSHIEISTYPSTLTYAVGGIFSPDGMVVKAYYTVDGFEGQVSKTVSPSSVSKPDMTTPGTKTVQVSYNESSNTMTAAFPITVAAKKVNLVALTTLPTKTEYTQGPDNALVLNGGALTVAYTNSALYPNETISLPNSGITVTGFNANYIGTQTITLTYTGFKTAYTITMKGNADVATSKSSALEILDSYGKPADYRSDEQAKLATAKSDGKNAINAATTVDGVNAALAKAKAAINALTTAAQYVAQELTAAKTNAKNELKSYKQQQNFTAAAWCAVQNKISVWSTAIDNCADTAAVDSALAAAKADLDTIVSGHLPGVSNAFVGKDDLGIYLYFETHDTSAVKSYEVYTVSDGTISSAPIFSTDAGLSDIYAVYLSRDTNLYSTPGDYTFMVKTVSSGNDFPAEVNCVGTVHVTKNNTATVAPAQSITYSGYEGHGNVAAQYTYDILGGAKSINAYIAEATVNGNTCRDAVNCAASDTDITLPGKTDKVALTQFKESDTGDGFTAEIYNPTVVPTTEDSRTALPVAKDAVFVKNSGGNLIDLVVTPADGVDSEQQYCVHFHNMKGEEVALRYAGSYNSYTIDATSIIVSAGGICCVRVESYSSWGSTGKASNVYFDRTAAVSSAGSAPDVSGVAAIYNVNGVNSYDNKMIVSGLEANNTYTVTYYDDQGAYLTIQTGPSFTQRIQSELQTSFLAGKGKVILSSITAASVTAGNASLTLTPDSTAVPVTPFGVTADKTDVHAGQSATLTALPSVGEHTYQWYSASTSTAAGTEITGATASSCTVYPTVTTYYYCMIDGKTSSRVALWAGAFAPEVTNAHFCLADGRLSIAYTEPDSNKKFQYQITFRDSDGTEFGGQSALKGTSSVLVDEMFSENLPDGVYTADVTSCQSSATDLHPSMAVKAEGSATVAHITTATVASGAVYASSSGTGCDYSIKAPGGLYKVTLCGSGDDYFCGMYAFPADGSGITLTRDSGYTSCKLEKITAEVSTGSDYDLCIYAPANLTFGTLSITASGGTDLDTQDNTISASAGPVTLTANYLAGTESTGYVWYTVKNGVATQVGTGKTVTVESGRNLIYQCVVDGAYRASVNVSIGTRTVPVTDAVLSVKNNILYTNYTIPTSADPQSYNFVLNSLADSGNHYCYSDSTNSSPAAFSGACLGQANGSYTVQATTYSVSSTDIGSKPVVCGSIKIVNSDQATNTSGLVLKCVHDRNADRYEYVLTATTPGAYRVINTGTGDISAPVYITEAGQTATCEASSSNGIYHVTLATAAQSGNDIVVTVYAPSYVNASSGDIWVSSTASGAAVSDFGAEVGSEVTLWANYNIGGSHSYQWYSAAEVFNTDGTAVANATSASFKTSNSTPGTYYYYCVIDGVRTSNVKVQIHASVSVTAGGTGVTVSSDGSSATADTGPVTLTVTTSIANPSYQWYSTPYGNVSSGTAISGATGSTYDITSGTAYYFCKVNGAYVSNLVKVSVGKQVAAPTVASLTVEGDALYAMVTPPADTSGINYYEVSIVDANGNTRQTRRSSDGKALIVGDSNIGSGGLYTVKVRSCSSRSDYRNSDDVVAGTFTAVYSDTPTATFSACRTSSGDCYVTPTESAAYRTIFSDGSSNYVQDFLGKKNEQFDVFRVSNVAFTSATLYKNVAETDSSGNITLTVYKPATASVSTVTLPAVAAPASASLSLSSSDGNGLLQLNYTAAADATNIDHYDLRIYDSNGNFVASWSSNLPGQINLESAVGMISSAGKYTVKVISVPTDTSAYDEASVIAGTFTKQYSSDTTPAMTITRSAVTSSGGTTYSYTLTPTLNAVYCSTASMSNGGISTRADYINGSIIYYGFSDSFSTMDVSRVVSSDAKGLVFIFDKPLTVTVTDAS